MAETNEITEFQSFSERTLKYGRNLMAVAALIIVFACIPAIDLPGSKPFNLSIQPEGERWIWFIFLAMLIYYGIRFVGLAIPDYYEWSGLFGKVVKERRSGVVKTKDHFDDKQVKFRAVKDNEISVAEIAAAERSFQGATSELQRRNRDLTIFLWRRWYFGLIDVGFPTLLFLFALWAGAQQIINLNTEQSPETPPSHRSQSHFP